MRLGAGGGAAMTLVAREDEDRVCAFWGMAGAVIVMAEPQWPQKFAPGLQLRPTRPAPPHKPLALPPPCADLPGTSCVPDGILLASWRESKRGKRTALRSRAECSAPDYALFASMRSRATLAQRAVSVVHRHLVDDLALDQAFEYPC